MSFCRHTGPVLADPGQGESQAPTPPTPSLAKRGIKGEFIWTPASAGVTNKCENNRYDTFPEGQGLEASKLLLACSGKITQSVIFPGSC